MLARKVTAYNDPLDHEIALRYITCFRNERTAEILGIIRNDLKTRVRTLLKERHLVYRIVSEVGKPIKFCLHIHPIFDAAE